MTRYSIDELKQIVILDYKKRNGKLIYMLKLAEEKLIDEWIQKRENIEFLNWFKRFGKLE